jgi:hypothetical protein
MNLQENINRIKEVMGILNEQELNFDIPEDIKKEADAITKVLFDKAKQYYINHYSKPETTAKFAYPENVDGIKTYIPTIKYIFYSANDGRFGFVPNIPNEPINLNITYLFKEEGGKLVPINELYNVIIHEMAHAIEYTLKAKQEKTITSTYNKDNVYDTHTKYTESDNETYARIQNLRNLLDLTPTSNGTDIKNKIIEYFNSGKITFPNVKLYIEGQSNYLGFTTIDKKKILPDLTNLTYFFGDLRINGTKNDDIAFLFAKFTYTPFVEDPTTTVFIDLNKLGEVNISVVDATKKPNTTTQRA